MASRKEKRRNNKVAAQIRRAMTGGFPHPALRHHVSAQTLTPEISTPPTSVEVRSAPPEPRILAEDIGKLIDLGIDEKTVNRLRGGGVNHIRQLPEIGKGGIRQIYGMKTRLTNLEQVLSNHGVALPP